MLLSEALIRRARLLASGPRREQGPRQFATVCQRALTLRSLGAVASGEMPDWSGGCEVVGQSSAAAVAKLDSSAGYSIGNATRALFAPCNQIYFNLC